MKAVTQKPAASVVPTGWIESMTPAPVPSPSICIYGIAGIVRVRFPKYLDVLIRIRSPHGWRRIR
jgi:hypothetical protein